MFVLGLFLKMASVTLSDYVLNWEIDLIKLIARVMNLEVSRITH